MAIEAIVEPRPFFASNGAGLRRLTLVYCANDLYQQLLFLDESAKYVMAEDQECVVQEAPLLSKTVLSEEVQPAPGAKSVEERCPICLEDFKDKAFVDACFHIQNNSCFVCTRYWTSRCVPRQLPISASRDRIIIVNNSTAHLCNIL